MTVVLSYFGYLRAPSSRLLFLGEIYAKLGAIAEGLNCVSEAQPAVDITGEREREAELNRSHRISEWQGNRRLGNGAGIRPRAKIVSTIAE